MLPFLEPERGQTRPEHVKRYSLVPALEQCEQCEPKLFGECFVE